MPELSEAEHLAYRSAWAAHPVLPLEVVRAKYDIPFPREWEVLVHETPSCQVPIASFSEWDEAQRWADRWAGWAREQGAHPGEGRGAIRDWWAADEDAREGVLWPPPITRSGTGVSE